MSDFHTDLVAALNEVSNPSEDGKANYGRYATLVECLKVAKQTLPKHNLAASQMVCSDPDRVVTSLIHASGENISDEGVPIHTADNRNPQKLGAAITYARRYGLCAILGIVGDEDDDAQSATPPEELPMARKVIPLKKVTPPPVVAVEKPDEDWHDWCERARIKLKGHRDLGELRQWFTLEKPQLEKLKQFDAKLSTDMTAWIKTRANQFENKGE